MVSAKHSYLPRNGVSNKPSVFGVLAFMFLLSDPSMICRAMADATWRGDGLRRIKNRVISMA